MLTTGCASVQRPRPVAATAPTDRISALFRSAVRLAVQDAFSVESYRLMRDAAVLAVREPNHALTCDILFSTQNLLHRNLMGFDYDVPNDVRNDLAFAEGPLMQACPLLRERADRQAAAHLNLFIRDLESGALLMANSILIIRRVETQTTCRAAELTDATLRAAVAGQHRTLARELARDLGELLLLCERVRSRTNTI